MRCCCVTFLDGDPPRSFLSERPDRGEPDREVRGRALAPYVLLYVRATLYGHISTRGSRARPHATTVGRGARHRAGAGTRPAPAFQTAHNTRHARTRYMPHDPRRPTRSNKVPIANAQSTHACAHRTHTHTTHNPLPPTRARPEYTRESQAIIHVRMPGKAVPCIVGDRKYLRKESWRLAVYLATPQIMLSQPSRACPKLKSSAPASTRRVVSPAVPPSSRCASCPRCSPLSMRVGSPSG